MKTFIFTNGIKNIEIKASNSTVAWEIFETTYGLSDYYIKD